MLVSIDDIVHQKQPCKDSCYAACIAMAIGRPVYYVLDILAARDIKVPLHSCVANAFLVKHDILPIRVDNCLGAIFEPDRIHFASILANGMHCVIVIIKNSKVHIYDPAHSSVQIYSEIPCHTLSVEALYDCSDYSAR